MNIDKLKEKISVLLTSSFNSLKLIKMCEFQKNECRKQLIYAYLPEASTLFFKARALFYYHFEQGERIVVEEAFALFDDLITNLTYDYSVDKPAHDNFTDFEHFEKCYNNAIDELKKA